MMSEFKRFHFPEEGESQVHNYPSLPRAIGHQQVHTPQQCRSSPEERGWHIAGLHWLELLLSVSYSHRYHMILVHPIPQHVFKLTQTGTLHKARTHLSVTIKSAKWIQSQGLTHRRVFGTIPQTGVLMVTHERNMRSKFR